MTKDSHQYETLIIEHQGPFDTLWLNRPSNKNALNRAMVSELTHFFQQLDVDNTRAVCLRGAGDVFCAGADIKEMFSLSQHNENNQQATALWAMNRAIGTLMSTVQSCGAVVVSAVHGAALGGGFGLMCVSDIIMTTSDAKMGMPETRLGLSPAQIAPFVLQRLGLAKAKQLALLGQTLSGQQALAMGLVDQVVEKEEELKTAWSEICQKIINCAPRANASTKALLQQSINGPSPTLLDQAATEFIHALKGQEGQEGTSAFAEKRAPYWAKQE